jgi:ferritin-like protein
MSTVDLHEPASALRAATIDDHRAYRSLIEELDAIDWYAQRIDASSDTELSELLAHNRDEEKEHACMVLEWIRRRDAKFDEFLRRYLFSDGPIAANEEENRRARDGARGDANRDGSLCVGSLRVTQVSRSEPKANEVHRHREREAS